ncbi:hypothetical protein ABZ366_21010 [Streptomyces sp. NPDC005904]
MALARSAARPLARSAARTSGAADLRFAAVDAPQELSSSGWSKVELVNGA